MITDKLFVKLYVLCFTKAYTFFDKRQFGYADLGIGTLFAEKAGDEVVFTPLYLPRFRNHQKL